jgi:hypothetical protein
LRCGRTLFLDPHLVAARRRLPLKSADLQAVGPGVLSQEEEALGSESPFLTVIFRDLFTVRAGEGGDHVDTPLLHDGM